MAAHANLIGARETAPLRIQRTWWMVIPLGLAGAVVAAPYALTHGFPLLGFAIRRGFALVCHQRPDRSFWVFGARVAICARCLGIYLGAAMGFLLRTRRRAALQFLIGAAILNLVDVGTELAGLHGNWPLVRFALGICLGAAGALLISSSMPEVVPKAEPAQNRTTR